MVILISILIIFISIILSIRWVKISTDKYINSESFRDSTKLGITITTLAFPLMISSSNYFEKENFWSIIIIFSVSTFLGLWNNFSIATLAESDGKIKIGKNNNNLMPTILVMQFFFMLFGIFLVLDFGKKPEEKKPEKEQIFLTRELFTIGNSQKELIKFWGIPNSENKHGDTVIYHYINFKTTTTYKIFNDSIIEINERKINNQQSRKHFKKL